MDGFFKLGEVLASRGGGGEGSEAYLQGLTGGYKAQAAQGSAEYARERARLMRSRNIAREAIPQALAEADYAENQRNLLANILLSNNTLDLDQLGDLAVPEAGAAYQAAAEAANLGDTATQNRQTALARGQQYEPFEAAAGGKAVLNPSTGELELTDLGDAAVLAQQALAGSRQASAGAANARADLTKRTDPNRQRTSTSAENIELQQAREAVQAGADPKMVADLLRKRGFPKAANKLYEAPDDGR